MFVFIIYIKRICLLVVNIIFALRKREERERERQREREKEDNEAFLSLKLSYPLLLYNVIIVKMKAPVNMRSCYARRAAL